MRWVGIVVRCVVLVVAMAFVAAFLLILNVLFRFIDRKK